MALHTPHFDTPTYERFRILILDRSGLHFPEKRRADLERGIAQAQGRSQCPDIESYYQLLSSKPTNGPEWESLIGQVTIGETYFFRDRGQFDALRGHVLPELIAQKRTADRRLRIWSAGCASGEEPYSLAMVLRDLLPDLAAWSITILATDINHEAIQRARRGRFGDWSFRESGWEHLQQRYFSRQGKEWELAPEVREMVTFAYLNLGEDPYPSMANNTVAFDLILCRNVTIYFTGKLVQHVVDRMWEALVDGGWLVVGHSEPAPVTYARFEARNFPRAVLYRKAGRPARFDLSWLTTAEAQPVAPVVAEPFSPQQPVAPAPTAVPAAALSPAIPRAPATPTERCQAIQSLLERGQADEALEELHQLLEQDTRCAQAYFLVGKIRANSALWEEARHWCEQAVRLDPLLAEAHFLLSLIHTQEESHDEAIAAMKRVVYLDSRSILGHFCLANLYLEAGNRARALKSLENSAVLLEKMPRDVAVPWSDGLTAGRLLHTVRQQMRELAPQVVESHQL